MSQQVGVVGLGIMGSAFSTHLLKAGYAVAGYDIVSACNAALEAKGGSIAANAQALADASDLVIISLPSVAAFHEVIAELAAAANDGLIILECSTLPIADKERGRDILAAAGEILLDCPISGTGAQAAAKDIALYASGDRQAYQAVIPIIEGFARSHYYVGEFGAGSKMKFVANLLVHIHNVASAEAMVLGMKAGLDASDILKVIKDGAGNSRIFELRGPMMVKNDYDDATMKINVWKKDMTVIREFARSLDSPTPMFDAGIDIYDRAIAAGLGTKDTAAVCAILEEIAGIKRSGSGSG